MTTTPTNPTTNGPDPSTADVVMDAPSVLRTGVPEDLPPPRPGERHVNVPFQTVVIIADDRLRDHVNARFYWPMIVLALVMLPLLAIEVFKAPEQFTPLWWVTTSCMVVIWFAFLIEFVIKFAIAECRIEYIRRNWLDIIILAIPVLRPLRVTYVAKTTRVFTLRGVGMKFIRYGFTIIVGFEATDRILQRLGLKSKVDRPDPKSMTRHQLTQELVTLRKRVDAWESWHEAHEDFHTERGFIIFDETRPLN